MTEMVELEETGVHKGYVICPKPRREAVAEPDLEPRPHHSGPDRPSQFTG